MARSVLSKTSQADLAVAVTGHLQTRGHNRRAPMVWIGAARRHREMVGNVEPRFFKLQQASRMGAAMGSRRTRIANDARGA